MDKNLLDSLMEEKRALFEGISDQIWGFAEPAFHETKSMELQKRTLVEEGFEITEYVADIPTAFKASYGSGRPVIAFLGEYDALPLLSQKADMLKREELNPGGYGHGCGHHLLGTGSVQAVIAVKKYMEKTGLGGTIIYYGCPAEEGEAGKAFMVKGHAFDGCDICLTWHPYAFHVCSMSSLANARVKYRFKGISSHAATSPHLGRSALDAVELMNVGCNYLREHMLPECRIHYAVTNTGGDAPNVVQSEAEVVYAIRAPQNADTLSLFNRVNKVAQGAALMTETEVEISLHSAYADLIQNKTLNEIVYKNMHVFSQIPYTEEDLEYAQQYKNLADKREIEQLKAMAAQFLGEKADAALSEPVVRLMIPPVNLKQGSNDVGDVSQCIPTACFSAACYAMGTAPHTWQAVAQGKSPLAHKGMFFASQVLAATAVNLLEDPDLIVKAKADFDTVMKGKEYVSLIPDGLKPAVLRENQSK
ncbi:MAG: amidohydrolase [Faecalicatena sp.]|uniref:amidohydrolase n=1 Tax=Faecalicatena sp. TaxID=2005360 RepID=UPI002589C30A|nr:amidohydrolase [Faecalicatena sp.]MCI6466182.1 amidohydrolase [Faecalicatena sp.]MDY5619348.1 amidohydrolase [Lachnospiraceae bacterium]